MDCRLRGNLDALFGLAICLISILIKHRSPFCFVLGLTARGCCPPNNAWSDAAGTWSVLFNKLQKQCVAIIHIHLAAWIGGHVACFFVISASASQSCRLTVTSTLNLVKRTKGRGRGSFRVSLYIRPNVSHNLPPFPVILASYGPRARSCHNCRWRELADYSVLHTKEEKQRKASHPTLTSSILRSCNYTLLANQLLG